VIGVRHKKEYIELYVQDFGKGIDPRYHQSIFDRYFRVPGTKVQGSGFRYLLLRIVNFYLYIKLISLYLIGLDGVLNQFDRFRNFRHHLDVILLKNITEFKELDSAKTTFISTISHELSSSADFRITFSRFILSTFNASLLIKRISRSVFKPIIGS